MREGCVNDIINTPIWFFLNASILALDLVSLLIDGLFYKALAEAPQAVLNHADASSLKMPVSVFVVLVCIIQLINIAISVYMYFTPGDNDNIFKIKKEKWPVILSVLVVWIDFAQIVIALSTAFRTNQLIGNVQIFQPVVALIKTFFQIPAVVRFYLKQELHNDDNTQSDVDRENWFEKFIRKSELLRHYFRKVNYTRIIENVESDLRENAFSSFQKLVAIVLAAFILNCCCSVLLLVRVFINL